MNKEVEDYLRRIDIYLSNACKIQAIMIEQLAQLQRQSTEALLLCKEVLQTKDINNE